MKKMTRRGFMVAAAGATLIAATGRAKGSDVLSETEFKAVSAIREVTGGKKVIMDKVRLTAPGVAENGSVVPVTVAAEGVKPVKMALIVDHNPQPLIMKVKIGQGGAGEISTRIRMKQTSTVRAYIEDANGKVYADTKKVQVTIGGCG